MAGRQPFRVPPALPAAAMKTYKIVAPVSTHWVPATCARVGCEAHEHGWVSYIDEGTGLGQRQAHFIRRESGRRFTEDRNDQGITEFTFEPIRMMSPASSWPKLTGKGADGCFPL